MKTILFCCIFLLASCSKDKEPLLKPANPIKAKKKPDNTKIPENIKYSYFLNSEYNDDQFELEFILERCKQIANSEEYGLAYEICNKYISKTNLFLNKYSGFFLLSSDYPIQLEKKLLTELEYNLQYVGGISNTIYNKIKAIAENNHNTKIASATKPETIIELIKKLTKRISSIKIRSSHNKDTLGLSKTEASIIELLKQGTQNFEHGKKLLNNSKDALKNELVQLENNFDKTNIAKINIFNTANVLASKMVNNAHEFMAYYSSRHHAQVSLGLKVFITDNFSEILDIEELKNTSDKHFQDFLVMLNKTLLANELSSIQTPENTTENLQTFSLYVACIKLIIAIRNNMKEHGEQFDHELFNIFKIEVGSIAKFEPKFSHASAYLSFHNSIRRNIQFEQMMIESSFMDYANKLIKFDSLVLFLNNHTTEISNLLTELPY